VVSKSSRTQRDLHEIWRFALDFGTADRVVCENSYLPHYWRTDHKKVSGGGAQL